METKKGVALALQSIKRAESVAHARIIRILFFHSFLPSLMAKTNRLMRLQALHRSREIVCFCWY